MQRLKLMAAVCIAVFVTTCAVAQNCHVSPGGPTVGGGQAVQFTTNCPPGGTWSVSGNGGTIDASGLYTGATFMAQGESRGCPILPRNSIFNTPVVGLPVHPNNAAWMARMNQAGSFKMHTNAAGILAEFDVPYDDGLPGTTMHFFEGGWDFDGKQFHLPVPPDIQTQGGYHMDVVPHGGFSVDNHWSTLNKTTCQLEQLYKPFFDAANITFTTGTRTLVSFNSNFASHQPLPNPVHAWIDNINGTCTSLHNGDTGWMADVIQQGMGNSGAVQLSIPFDSSHCTIISANISGIDENGTGGGDPSTNAQAGGIFNVNDNSLHYTSNAAGTILIGGHEQELYNRVQNQIQCPESGGRVCGRQHGSLWTATNNVLAPHNDWPATGSTNWGHGTSAPVSITNGNPATVTNALCGGQSCNALYHVCNYQSGAQCTPGTQKPLVFENYPASSPWAVLNGKHLTATYVSSPNGNDTWTIPFDTTNLGPYPANTGDDYNDWIPYGACIRLPQSFNCQNICSDNSLTGRCVYAKAECESYKAYCTFMSDGTSPDSDTGGSESFSSLFNPDFLAAMYGGNPDDSPGLYNWLPPLSQWEFVDVSSLNINGPNDGSTSVNRTVVTYTVGNQAASTDVYAQGTTLGLAQERMLIPSIPGNTYQVKAWVNFNADRGITYSMSPAVSGASIDPNTGVITPPANITALTQTFAKVCSHALPTECQTEQIFFVPVDPLDGAVRLWLGAQNGMTGCGAQPGPNFHDNANKTWSGAFQDSGYPRIWQSVYVVGQGLNFTHLLGDWVYCSSWNNAPNAQLYAYSTSNTNDQKFTAAVPNGTYSVLIKAEPGYNTHAANQDRFEVIINGQVVDPNVDGYVKAGGAFKGFDLGPYTATVTNGIIDITEGILTEDPAQYEGISISAVEIKASGPPPPLSIASTSPLPDATVNAAYQFQFVGNGGQQPYNWTASGLPSWLTLDATGLLHGTPSQTGTSQFTVTVTDSSSPQQQASGTFSLTVDQAPPPPLTLSCNFPQGQDNSPYNGGCSATGGVPPYTFVTTSCKGVPANVCDGHDVAGLSMDPNTGKYSGDPTAAGLAGLSVQVSDSQNAKTVGSYSVKINAGNGPPPLNFPPVTLAPGTEGIAYSATFAATGGTPPLVWSMTGAPAGATLDPATGQFAWASPVAGVYSFTVTVHDSGTPQQQQQQGVTLTINAVQPPPPTLKINPITPPPGTVGVAYNLQLTASNYVLPLSWTVVSGSLPDGLSLGPISGAITGIPKTAGNFTFTVQVQDGSKATATAQLTITISGGGSKPPIFALSPFLLTQQGVAYSLALKGIGTLPLNWSWAPAKVSGSLPPGLTLDKATGVVSGKPTAGGIYTVVITLTDGNGQKVSHSTNVVVLPPLHGNL